MIHLFPIEPIEERYSQDWYRWFPRKLEEHGLSVTIYDGDRIKDFSNTEALKTGEFLDAFDTHHYKATQLSIFMRQLQAGRIKDNDTVLMLDGWNPSVTALAYARAVSGINFKIVLALHAGTWDIHDHLSRCGMRNWAQYNELGWLLACDSVIVATEFHRDLIMDTVELVARTWSQQKTVRNKIHVTGFPLELGELNGYQVPWDKKKNQVVFPHRIAPEKAPEIFEEVKAIYEKMYPEDKLKWVRTQDVLKSLTGPVKPQFYKTLAESKVAFSSALQETWGIAQLEAWYLTASPVVPDRLSYRELYPADTKYDDLETAANMIHEITYGKSPIPFEPTTDPRNVWPDIIKILKGDA
jgi:glycosyltransferase involved in cell wall biosynthesis